MPCSPSVTGGGGGNLGVPAPSDPTTTNGITTIPEGGGNITSHNGISVISPSSGFSPEQNHHHLTHSGFSPDQIHHHHLAGSTSFPSHLATRPPLPPPPRLASSHCIHGRPLTNITAIHSSSAPTQGDHTQGSASNNNGNPVSPDRPRPWWRSWNRKYVLLCGTCGMSSVLLGTFYLIIFFVLRSYTESLQYFQTMPTYIPACLLMVTGFLVLCLMRRKSRYSILIKVVGILCLVCAVVCVVVTVTTTVLHMNRLQTLSECTFYTQLHSCTCQPFTDEKAFDLKLDISITTCDVIHGALYSCLRAMFGVSVIGILVSIFSCMLVYQLLSHEKKKMYWEQLENRRRLLYRRNPTAANGTNCNCCDEYGFVPSNEMFPWRMWDTVDDRYWNGGAQLYSPNGEDSSNASRSVLLGGTNPNGGGPSLWLPWGGAWGAAAGMQGHPHLREMNTQGDGTNGLQDNENNLQGEEHRPQATGVLLRPFLPRGLEARFGLRRQPPPPPGVHGRRPLSDPGVALQLPRYPPPFSEAYLPPLPYEGLEAFSRLMWDPPPPYSQPASAENLVSLNNIATSPISPQDAHRAFNILASPIRRPTTLADLIRGSTNSPSTGISSPSDVTENSTSPAHFAIMKDGSGLLGNTGSLPLSHRLRRLPLGHVKSLGDVTEGTRESLELIFCDGKEINSLEDKLQKFHSHDGVTQKLLSLKSNHLKSISDPKNVYSKGDQESELYFADVSSCVSLRADGEDTLYYSEPTSQKDSSGDDNNKKENSVASHHYEQVLPNNGQDEDEELNSHHTSDDTMIVHTSSSDHSLGVDTENTYSIVSPLTDQSSASPMVTDTDASSCYQTINPPPPKEEVNPRGNLNFHLHHQIQKKLQPQKPFYPGKHPHHNHFNDNEREEETEPRYEIIPGDISSLSEPKNSDFVAASDLNGNLAAGQREAPIVRHAQRTNLSLPLRRPDLPSEDDKVPKTPEKEPGTISQNRRTEASKSRPNKRFKERSSSSEGSTPTDRRLQSVQDHLYKLKSVNV